jgi:hypothetical protein
VSTESFHEVLTTSDGLTGRVLGLICVYGSHVRPLPCSFGSVRVSVAPYTPWHSPPMVISHPLDIMFTASTVTGESFCEVYGQ